MIKKLLYSFVFIILIFFNHIKLHAEITRFPCEVLSLDQKQTIFYLKSGITVETSSILLNKKVKILIQAYFRDSFFVDEYIQSNTKLYDTFGNIIGNTLKNIYPERFIRNDSNGLMMVELFGYVNDFVIKQESSIEYCLSTILNSKKKEFTYSEFKKFIDTNNFQKWPDEKNLTTYFVVESKTDRIKPGKRVVLIFLNNDLAAIIYSRNLKLRYFESHAESKPYKIYYMKKMSDSEKRQISLLYFNKVKMG